MTANRTSTGIARFVRTLGAQVRADQTDGQLVSQFLARRDEAASAGVSETLLHSTARAARLLTAAPRRAWEQRP
jgi:hypothetical protein